MERVLNIVNKYCPEFVGYVDPYVSEMNNSFGSSWAADKTDDDILDDFLTFVETMEG